MREVSVGVKFFAGSQVRRQKKWMKRKNKSGELSKEEIQEFTEHKKTAIKFGMRVFNGT